MQQRIAPRLGLVIGIAVFALTSPALGWGEDLAALESRFEKAEKESGAKEAYLSLRADFESFAKANGGTADGLEAELWLLRMHWWSREDGTMQKEAGSHAKRLVREYGAFDAMVRIPEFSYLFSVEDFDEICRDLVEASPHREVKAGCLYARASKLRRKDSERARELFQSLADEYSDVRFRTITYGEIAAAHLDPHPKSALKVGEVAPEIVGIDINGQPMKLSDYRGKVVVLDFWGDW